MLDIGLVSSLTKLIHYQAKSKILFMVESHYKTSASSTNSTMSLIKLRTDISNLLAATQRGTPAKRAISLFFSHSLSHSHFQGEHRRCDMSVEVDFNYI